VIIFIVVDLPAPLGPRNPTISPLPIEKEIVSTAFYSPKCLDKLLTCIDDMVQT